MSATQLGGPLLVLYYLPRRKLPERIPKCGVITFALVDSVVTMQNWPKFPSRKSQMLAPATFVSILDSQARI